MVDTVQQVESGLTDRASRREITAKWKKIVAEYQTSNAWRANWQLLNSIGGYLGLWFLIYMSLSVSWWLTIPLSILAGGLLLRVFIIFHDCGHGSFFKSQRANDIWGYLSGLLVFTAYYHWRWEHAVHHANSGHLEKRGMGDIWTLTVEEYLESSRWRKFSYRLARNPIVLFLLAPLYLFVLRERFSSTGAKPRERRSIWITNLGLAAIALVLIHFMGFLPWLIVQFTILAVTGSCGVWLFYVQHQFEDTYWERKGEWDFTAAALRGSSFYKLPKVLQWFTGNIGFHHIHHLSSAIPNYNLERCHRSDPMFSDVRPMTLLSSMKAASYRLWDEQSKKLVGFAHLKNLELKAERDRTADALNEKLEEILVPADKFGVR